MRLSTIIISRGEIGIKIVDKPIVEPTSSTSLAQDLEMKKDHGRFYHLMVAYKHYLCVYGGQSDTGGLVKRAYRPVHCEIFLFDLHKNRWEEVCPKNLNRVETSRRNHCGAVLGDWLVVYGGLNTCVNYLDDLQGFSFLTKEWKRLQAGGKRKPPALARSAMQIVVHRQREEQLIMDFQ